MPSRNNIATGIIILLTFAGSTFWYWQKFQSKISPLAYQDVAIPQPENTPLQKIADPSGPNSQPNQAMMSSLEDTLLDTAWVQLDQNGKETDFEIEFRKTKENDPLRQSYDYEDYLHHRPGTSGYWKAGDNTITITINANPAYLSSSTYTGINFTGNILQMNEPVDNITLKFQRIISPQEDTTLGDIVTVDAHFLAFVKQKIGKEYRASGSTDQAHVCWQYINDEYLISYDNDNEDFGKTTLSQEKSLRINVDSLSIIPTGYSSAVKGSCVGTSIDFSFSELAPYIKSGGLLEKIR